MNSSKIIRVITRGMNSSYYIQTNVSVERGVIWGISVPSIDKGGVLFFSIVYILKGY